MSLPEKPINQIPQTEEVADNSLFIVEKSEGTKVINYAALAAAIAETLGVSSMPELVDTLNITEEGYISEGYLVSDALNDRQAQIRAAQGYFGKELNYTWAELSEKAAAGDFTGINVGDYKDITLSTNESVRMEVAGIDTYLGYQSGFHHRLYFISRDCLATAYRMNVTNVNAGGFPATELKTTLNTTIYNTLPAELKSVIKTDKRLDSTKGNWAWQEDQKLWLPSETEVWGHNTWSEQTFGNGNGIQFPIFTNSLRHISKGMGKGQNAAGVPCGWWCSSPHAADTASFCYVSYSGLAVYNAASTALGVPVCFTI